jgi:uncharacterized membrane protein/nitrite reductase/ring-hydroxylating ferredoxin subunit
MRSRAHIKGHPLHPILVAFPIAFFTGALFFDLAFLFSGKIMFPVVAGYLELTGVIFYLLAAVPGIVDNISVVPPKSSAKKRATQHGVLNLLVVSLFGFAWFLRSREEFSFLSVIGIEILGMSLLTVSGWLGGTLVYRNQIGVDHRYAGAGKWKEERLDSDLELKHLQSLELNQMKLIHVKNKRVVIGKTESGYVAFDDRCTHRGASLADGSIICGTVQCPWHGSQFDVKNGALKAGPAKENIRCYEIENRDNKFYLRLDSK